MLISGTCASEYEAAIAVAWWLQRVFEYVPDVRLEGGPTDRWPTRAELEAQHAATRKIRGDCDDSAFAAVYGMADLGYKARVVVGWTEAPARGYHALCETESGYLIDNRFPGRVMVWADQPDFVKDALSSFFEHGEVGKWYRPARDAA